MTTGTRSRLDFVRPREQGWVPVVDIEEERLVGLRRLHGEGRAVREVHGHRAHVQLEAGDLRSETQHDPLVGLDAQHEQVRLRLLGRIAEELEGRAVELDGDLGRALGQAFARPQVERNAGPAPALELEAQRDVGLRERVRGDLGLLPIAHDAMALDPARTVLAAHDVVIDLFPLEPVDGAEHAQLLVAQGLGLEGDGRLHGDQAEELEQMVLEDVA